MKRQGTTLPLEAQISSVTDMKLGPNTAGSIPVVYRHQGLSECIVLPGRTVYSGFRRRRCVHCQKKTIRRVGMWLDSIAQYTSGSAGRCALSVRPRSPSLRLGHPC